MPGDIDHAVMFYADRLSVGIFLWGSEMFRKLICLLLSAILLIHSGCSTMRVVQSVHQAEVQKDHEKLLLLTEGQLVRITYTVDGSSENLKGKIKSITATSITIVHRGNDVKLFLENIEKIDIYDREFDIVTTVAVTALGTMGILVIIGILHVYGIVPLPGYSGE